MNPYSVTEADLHAYVDGFLATERAREIEAYLAARPEQQRRIEVYRKQNDALRELFNPVLDEAIPPRLSAGLKDWRAQFGRYAAGLLIAVVSGASGWMLHDARVDTVAQAVGSSAAPSSLAATLPRQAAVAHAVYSPDARRPVEIRADQEQQLIAWLSKRLGSTMRPPKLGKLGYELIGGRLLPGSSGPVAQFMYQDIKGERLTLYVSTDQQDNHYTGFRFAQEGSINVFYWIDGKFGYALSAGIARSELSQIANAVFEQLENPS